MKKRVALIGCCIAAMILFSGCRSGSEKAVETETPAATETSTEMPTVTETSTEMPVATETPTEMPAATQTEVQQEVPAGTEESVTEQSEVRVYEEDLKQCPYCAQWFSTLQDDDLWNPYDRHMLEEREKDPAGGQTEQEMVQCPDCGNWYESGNIFRNHICEGKS